MKTPLVHGVLAQIQLRRAWLLPRPAREPKSFHTPLRMTSCKHRQLASDRLVHMSALPKEQLCCPHQPLAIPLCEDLLTLLHILQPDFQQTLLWHQMLMTVLATSKEGCYKR